MRIIKPLSILALILLTTPTYAQSGFNLVGNKPPVATPQSESPTEDVGTSSEFVLASTESITQPVIGSDKYEIPPTEIGGADTTYSIGDIVQLWIKPIPQKPEFLESVMYSWTILPSKKSIVWPDSTRVIFGTGSKSRTYTVILTASYVYVEPGNDKPTIAQRAITKSVQVKVGDGQTPDPDEPDDPNPPDPPDPGLSGLSKSAFDWTAFVEVGPDYGVNEVKQDAAVLANNFTQIAAAIDNGELVSITSILQKTKDLNDSGTVNRNAWLPWFVKMSEYLKQAYRNGTISTPAQFSEAWKQISKGLAAAAQ